MTRVWRSGPERGRLQSGHTASAAPGRRASAALPGALPPLGLLLLLLPMAAACGDDDERSLLAAENPEAAFCESVAACNPAMLLVSEPECTRQLSERAAGLNALCRSCALTLSCAGIDSVGSGKVDLHALCPDCELSGPVRRNRLAEQGCERCSRTLSLAQVIALAEGRATLHSLCESCPVPIGEGLPRLLIPGIRHPELDAPAASAQPVQAAGADGSAPADPAASPTSPTSSGAPAGSASPQPEQAPK